MRVARVWTEGQELAALEHRGEYYRVDKLDETLGTPLPRDVAPSAACFATRVFGLGLAGLDAHDEALRDGTRTDDARLPSGSHTLLLPPTGRDPALLELPLEGDSDLGSRGNGRAILGHDQARVFSRGERGLQVAAALAVVVSDDLHVPSPSDAARAALGVTLGLSWVLAADEARGLAEGLGPQSGREIGTHLGPFLSVAPFVDDTLSAAVELSAVGQAEPSRWLTMRLSRERVGRALARAARYGDVMAGDVLLFTSRERMSVEPGWDIDLRSEQLGRLRGRVGSRGRR